jgi:hypothetical protein
VHWGGSLKSDCNWTVAAGHCTGKMHRNMCECILRALCFVFSSSITTTILCSFCYCFVSFSFFYSFILSLYTFSVSTFYKGEVRPGPGCWGLRGEVELYIYSFFNLGARWGLVVNATPQLFYLRVKTQYPLYRRLSGPQSQSGWAWKISPSPGFDSRTVQPFIMDLIWALHMYLLWTQMNWA